MQAGLNGAEVVDNLGQQVLARRQLGQGDRGPLILLEGLDLPSSMPARTWTGRGRLQPLPGELAAPGSLTVRAPSPGTLVQSGGQAVQAGMPRTGHVNIVVVGGGAATQTRELRCGGSRIVNRRDHESWTVRGE